MRPRFQEFGITRLARLTGLDNVGIPVWAAFRPNSRTLASSQGKGLDDDAAAASAVMEAIEVACAEDPPLDRRKASYGALASGAVEVRPLYELLRAGEAPDRDCEISWVKGFDLRTGNAAWLPIEAVSLTKEMENSRYWQSTDGLASGNNLEEAIFHGLCERIERDALILWRLRSDSYVASRCFDGKLLKNDALNGLIDLIESANLSLRLFNITTDLGMPVCFATISRIPCGTEHNWTHFDLASGSGCHIDLARAAIRAVTEAAQTRLTTISGSRDDFHPSTYRRTLASDLLIYIRCEFQPLDVLAPALPVSPNHLDWARLGAISVVPVALEAGQFAVVKVFAPALESPSGRRQRPYGPRAYRAAAARL